ncbi:hypothetical protein J5N58_11330 [Rhizobium cremeum]|uniref:YrbL family protein n=1 Tax=Rhizobium cremeum TaxID=2813827 RepID=UPI0013B03220|nr:YrbL family protein [Rhizobium cremeum]MCJ7994733.1 hypothetical protein [Rhizobium cremeum]MCJ8000271.1 hypothetical protein [Rhizobium cremeum]
MRELSYSCHIMFCYKILRSKNAMARKDFHGRFSSRLDIAECKFETAGSLKRVYTHPDMQDVVLKIIDPARTSGDARLKGESLMKRTNPLGVYRGFRRELTQYLILSRRWNEDLRGAPPIAVPCGLVSTTAGLALVTEKIGGAGDTLAPTLEKLFENGALAFKHLKALNRLFDDCMEMHVVLSDMHMRQFLYSETRSGRPEFVVIDGIGEKNIIPLRSLSPLLNRRRLKRARDGLFEAIFARYPALKAEWTGKQTNASRPELASKPVA